MRRRFVAVARRGLLALAAGLLLAAAGPDPKFIALIQEMKSLSDRNDAAGVMTKLAAGLATFAEPGRERAVLLSIRADVLERQGKTAEALADMDQVVAMLPDNAEIRIQYAGLQRKLGKNADAARTVIFIADAVPNGLDDLSVRWIGALIRDLADDKETRFDLEMALASRGYDVADDPGRVDWMVADAVLGLIERDRIEEARALVPRLIDTSTMIEMIADRRYQSLWPALEAKAGPHMKTALAAERAAVEAAWRREPGNLERITDQANSLHAAGRSLDAVKVGAPLVADMAKIEQEGENGFWLANAQAHALAGAGRVDEADALFRKLLALGIDKHPDLISMAINHSSMLLDEGRTAPALEAADKIDALDRDHMSDYGRMWVWKTQACAAAALGLAERSAAALAKMQPMQDKNVGAAMLALLCTDRLDAAEKLVLKRLADPDKRPAMLTALQDFEPVAAEPFADAMRAKLLVIRDRPAVRKALETHGRVTTIAAGHSLWGGF